MPMLRAGNWKALAAGCIAAAAIGVLLAQLSSGSRRISPTVASQQRDPEAIRRIQQAQLHQVKRYREVPTLLSSAEPGAGEFSAAFGKQLQTVLSGELVREGYARHRHALADIIGKYVEAICVGDVDDYLNVISENGYAPLRPNGPQWRVAHRILAYHYGQDAPAVDRDDPIGTLRPILEKTFFSVPRMFVDVGVGSGGVQVVSGWIRDPSERFASGFVQGDGTDPSHVEYWLANGSGGLLLATSPISAEQIIRRDGRALVATVAVVLKRHPELGDPASWVSDWLWDPLSGKWYYWSGGISGAPQMFIH